MNKRGFSGLVVAGGLSVVIVLSLFVGGLGSHVYGKLIAPPVNPDMGDAPGGSDPECLAVANSCDPVVNNTDPDPDPDDDANDGAVEADPDESIGPFIAGFYTEYVDTYVLVSGAVISNHVSVPWCPNGCIGCDKDRSSEAWGRLIKVAADYGDRSMVDRELQFFKETMRHPDTGFAMWKLNEDGSTGSCGGQNSAVDAEMLAAEGLFVANDRWGMALDGRSYQSWAMDILESLRPALIDGKYLPHCAYPAGDEGRPCERRTFLGYNNLRVLKQACGVDGAWCDIYEANKNLMIGAVQDGGVYSVYYHDSGNYALENDDIHNNWALKHLAIDGGADAWGAVRPLYEDARDRFLSERAAGGTRICEQYAPGSGCKLSSGNPSSVPQRIYAHWLEISSNRCGVTGDVDDCAFRDELIAVLVAKHQEHDLFPLVAQDNFGNIVVMEAYAEALRSGADIEG